MVGWGRVGGGGGGGSSLKTCGTGLGAADFFGSSHTSRFSLLDLYHLLSFSRQREMGVEGGGGGAGRGWWWVGGCSLKTCGTGLGAADFFCGNHASRLSLLDPYHLLSFYKQREGGGGGRWGGGYRLKTCGTGLGAADFFCGNHASRLSLLDPYHLLSFYKQREGGGGGRAMGGGGGID